MTGSAIKFNYTSVLSSEYDLFLACQVFSQHVQLFIRHVFIAIFHVFFALLWETSAPSSCCWTLRPVTSHFTYDTRRCVYAPAIPPHSDCRQSAFTVPCHYFCVHYAKTGCGHLNTKLTLTDRTYLCQQCGMVKDRDLNAAQNLHRAGLARIYACGHDGSVS